MTILKQGLGESKIYIRTFLVMQLTKLLEKGFLFSEY